MFQVSPSLDVDLGDESSNTSSIISASNSSNNTTTAAESSVSSNPVEKIQHSRTAESVATDESAMDGTETRVAIVEGGL